MGHDPLDTTGYKVPSDPLAVADALRHMADGEGDYLGRLLMVAAHHIELFAKHPSSRSSDHLNGARALAEAPVSAGVTR